MTFRIRTEDGWTDITEAFVRARDAGQIAVIDAEHDFVTQVRAILAPFHPPGETVFEFEANGSFYHLGGELTINMNTLDEPETV